MRVSFYYIIFQTIYISLKTFYLDNFIIFNMFNKTFFSFGNGPWHLLMLGISIIWHDNFVVELSADYSETWKRVCLYKKIYVFKIEGYFHSEEWSLRRSAVFLTQTILTNCGKRM